jgi:hypothetical protein
MTFLAIDVGNTRLKWAHFESPEPGAALPLAEVRYEYRWGLVPADWGFIMRGELPPGRSFADAPASAVHKLDEALRVRACRAPLPQGAARCAGRGRLVWEDDAPRARRAPLANPQLETPRPPPKQVLGLHECAHHAAAAGAPRPWAIDLGAAPGAWSQHLARCLGYAVAAVDPAELSPAVLELPAVRHVRARSEAAGPALEALLPPGGAELLVSDMCAHPVHAVKVGAGGGVQVRTRRMGRVRTHMEALGSGRARGSVAGGRPP